MKKTRRKSRARSVELLGPALVMAALSAWAGGELYLETTASEAPAAILECSAQKGSYAIKSTDDAKAASMPENCPDTLSYLLGHKMNINTAAPEDLDILPGVGAVTAEKIVAERGLRGGFKSLNDLENISGISSAARQGLQKWTEVR